MTLQLSPHKVSKILRGYFRGLPQITIARGAGVDQSSISHYASRFKKTAFECGLLAAGKEYQVLNEVESLRSLSVELYKSKLTVEEARQGHNIIKAFLKLGVSPEQHLTLIKVCQKVANPGFINAALKLNKIEANNQMSYEEVTSKYERITSELPLAEKELKKMKAEQESLRHAMAQYNKEIPRRISQLAQLEEEMIMKKARLGKELEAEMKRLAVNKHEVEEAAKLKGEMAARGINISTLMLVAEEFKQ